MVVELYAPNLIPDDLEVTISNNILKIEGSKSKEEEIEKKQYYRKEYVNNSFVRTVVLPTEVDETKAEAKHENGVLKIVFPKKEVVLSKKIKVN